MRQTPERWELRTHNGFELRDQDGLVRKLPYRSVEELLLALARSGTAANSRDELGEQLWPSLNVGARRTNLRQTLHQLRKVLGESAISSNRSTCTLNPQFGLKFVEELPSLTATPGQLSPGRALGMVVEWLSESDPKQMLDMLRASPDLSLTVPRVQLLNSVIRAEKRLRPDDLSAPWLLFWKGYAIMNQGRIREAIPFLRTAAKRGIELADWVLLREASRQLGFCEILRGRPHFAHALAEKVQIASKDLAGRGCHKLEELRGTALLHMGRQREALEALGSLERFSDVSSFDFAIQEARQAFYFSVCGNHGEALKRLDLTEKLAGGLDYQGSEVICTLAKGCIEASTEPHRAIERLTKLLAYCEANSIGHVDIYAQETLAVAHHARGERSEALQMLVASRKARSHLGFQYTQWDRNRLGALAN